jgi:PAS domain S-box-containing protein
MNNISDNDLKKILSEQNIIIDSIPAWIFYKNKENKFIRVNKTFCEAMGKTKEELEDKSLFDMYSKEIAQSYWTDDLEVINTGKAKIGIIEKTVTSKGQRWVQTDKIPYYDEEGKIIGVIGFAIDITKQKEADESYKNSQLILQRIIDLLPIRIFWKDKNLKYLGCNLIFAHDAGKDSVEEMIGNDDLHMPWGEQADSYRKDDLGVINSGVSKLDYEEEQTTPKGDKIFVITNKVPLKNTAGEIQGVLGTYLNNTDRKKIDDKLKIALEETNKMNQAMVDRELKMIELKKRIEELESKLKASNLN